MSKPVDKLAELKLKLEKLRVEIFKHESYLLDNLTGYFGDKPKFICFISVSDGESRAHVRHGIGNTLDSSWKNAANQMNKLVRDQDLNPKWVKADAVHNLKEYSYKSFMEHVSSIKRNYFRDGISFDPMLNLAFLEQEVNGNVFIHGLKEQKAQLAFNNINSYAKSCRGLKYKLTEELIKNVYTFNTISYFHDENDCYKLMKDWLNNGRREVSNIDKDFLFSIIDKSSLFLADQLFSTGEFRYGYFPCFDKEIDHYNILRHASTTYSMVEAYEVTRSEELRLAIENSLHYLLHEAIQIYGEPGDPDCKAFVIEKVSDNEIKLGSNAHALLAMSKYTQVFQDDKFLPVMEMLAEGITYFQNKEDGSFVHVLNFPDLSVKEAFRTIYYDGEAAFALMRYYEIVKDDKWLHIVEKAFEYFIVADHWKHGDHWLSYCSNELVKYKPERKYVEFNLKNAGRRLDFCLTRETTFPTLLELLMASYSMITKLKNENLYTDLLESFDEGKLMKAIEHRVNHQLSGWFCPEFAMYFKTPKNILWSFFIRHHSFRVRIDDIEHNISGYCSYYHQIAE